MSKSRCVEELEHFCIYGYLFIYLLLFDLSIYVFMNSVIQSVLMEYNVY